MEFIQQNKMRIVIVIAGIVIAGFAVQKYVHEQQAAYLTKNIELIATQEERLAATVRDISNNNLERTLNPVVTDCTASNRSRFDELLGGLASLSRAELVELDVIFGGCAYYYSTLQTVAVFQFAREIEIYKEFLELASSVDAHAAEKLNTIPLWESLLEKEQERSMFHTELVDVQREIIAELLTGNTINSPSVQTLVQKGQEIRGNLTFSNTQIKQIHPKLLGS